MWLVCGRVWGGIGLQLTQAALDRLMVRLDDGSEGDGGGSNIIAENELQEAPADEKEEPLAHQTSSPRKRNKLYHK